VTIIQKKEKEKEKEKEKNKHPTILKISDKL